MSIKKNGFLHTRYQKYTFLVIKFGPTNAHSFYSDMTKKFKDEWEMILIETLCNSGPLVSGQVTVTQIYEVLIGDKNLILEIRTIIDDILL